MFHGGNFMHRTRSFVLGSLLLLTLAGCGGTRPLHVIQRDGDHFYSTKRWDLAVENYSEYLQRAPDNNVVRMKLGESQMNAGDPRAAIESLKIALDVDPLNDRIADGTAEALYQAGEREALTTFVQRIASERGRVKDYLRIADYMNRVGHADEAQTALVTASKISQGNNFDVQWALVKFYKNRGDADRTIERLRMAYFLQPENAEVLAAIREMGEIPGPSFALAPREMDIPRVTNALEPVIQTK
jgi:tetratricopeptide (TPR) repeat protein